MPKTTAQVRQQRAQCRLSARRALRLVECYLEAAGSVTHELPTLTRVKVFLYCLQDSLSMKSSDTLCHLQLPSAFQAADPPQAAANSAAHMLLQSQRSLVAPTMVKLNGSNLICYLMLYCGLTTLCPFSYRSSAVGCLWNEVWRLLSCCEAHTDGQSRDSKCCCQPTDRKCSVQSACNCRQGRSWGTSCKFAYKPGVIAGS